MDYEIVKAIRDSSLVASLSQVQQSELNSIREYKNPVYFKFLQAKPEKIVLSQDAREKGILVNLYASIIYKYIFVVNQGAKNITDKPRLGVILIGSLNCGKSTIAGHLIYKCGMIERRILEKYKAVRTSPNLNKHLLNNTRLARKLEKHTANTRGF